MLTRTKVFSLTVAALLILTLAPGAPFGHASLGYARDRQGEPTTAARTRIGRIETDTFDSATNDPPNPAHPPFSTADAENVELVGHIGGTTEAVAVQGNYAYIGEGPRLTILDISNPASPTVVGKTVPLPGFVRCVAVAGDCAYIAADEAGLRVVDISTPSNPTEVGFYDTPGSANDVAVAGGYAYVGDYEAGLRVVDVSTPSNPTEVGFYDTPGYACDVAVAGGYAYVADYEAGLRVVDVSTPSNPTEVGFYDTPGYADGVAVAGGYAYVADSWGGLQVLDVSTPANPTEVGFYDTPGYAEGVAVAGGYAYVADGGRGLRVVDVSTPSNPTEVGFYDTPGNAWAVAGGYAYVADWIAGLRVVDVSTPSNPTEVGFYDTPGNAWGVAVAGGYAYVADYEAGLRVVDVSTPSEPTEVGFYETPGHATGVAVAGDYAYVADGDGLRVVDVSTPSNPTEVGFYDTPGGAEGVAVAGGYAYIADWIAGLRVVDISDPANPTEVGFHDTPGSVRCVAVAGGYAYVADLWGGLRVVDVSTPSSPTEVGFYDTPGGAEDVAVAGGYAYVADGDGGLVILRYTGGEAGIGLAYTGPLYLPDTSVVEEETDGRITMGDHVHLRLPFRNTASEAIANGWVNITAVSAQPAVTLHDGSDWGVQATILLTPTVIAPGKTGVADFWLYVDNPDPDDRHTLSGQAQIRVATADGEWDIGIRLDPISFPADEHVTLTRESCLHHPNSFRIRNYAQYAAGACKKDKVTDPCRPFDPPTNAHDPDTPEQATRSLVQRVKSEFWYKEGVWEYQNRVVDALLVTKRLGYIGVCRHYADLTVGLLRSLGIPTRWISALFFRLKEKDLVGHAWTEVYTGTGALWRQADSTWDTSFNEGIYEESGYSVRGAWADQYPLAVIHYDNCVPDCYQPPVDCIQCWRALNESKEDWPGGCTEDVRYRYHNVGLKGTRVAAAGQVATAGDEQILVHIQAPVFVTRTLPFTLSAGLVNSTTQTLDVLTATVSVYDDISSTVPLYDVAPPYHTVSSLSPGRAVTVTWTVTPLVAGSGLPLRVAAFSGDVFGVDERPLVVNEPGTPPPLTLDGLCGPGTVQPGQPLTLTAYVLDETLQPLTDTLTTITATLYATPTLGYSDTVPLALDADGFFRRVLTLPMTVPIGTWWVDFTATRPGYEKAHGESSFFVAPPLTMTLEVTPTAVAVSESMTLTAQVYERGTALTEASVWAQVNTPDGVVTVPLVYGSGVYTAAFCPADLAPNLGGSVKGGQWQIMATADYYGSNGKAAGAITVRHGGQIQPVGGFTVVFRQSSQCYHRVFRRLYLPLILRNY